MLLGVLACGVGEVTGALVLLGLLLNVSVVHTLKPAGLLSCKCRETCSGSACRIVGGGVEAHHPVCLWPSTGGRPQIHWVVCLNSGTAVLWLLLSRCGKQRMWRHEAA